MQLKVAPSSHLVLDLIDLSEYMWHVRFGKFKKSSFLTYYMHYEYGFHQKLSGGSSFEEVPEEPEELVFATDDEWMIDERQDGADPRAQTDEANQVRPKEWTYAHSVGVSGREEDNDHGVLQGEGRNSRR